MSKETNEQIAQLLDAKPDQADILRRWSGIRTNKELAGTVVFFTYILMDLEQRGGGNPFDNRNIIYSGTPDDNALNDGVKRYTSSPRAIEYLHTYYTPPRPSYASYASHSHDLRSAGAALGTQRLFRADREHGNDEYVRPAVREA